MEKFLNSSKVTEKKSGYFPEWAMELEPVRNLPTNDGSRIRKCICEALQKDPPEWAKKRLRLSISKEVYNRNASGPTKRVAVSVLSDFEEEIVREKKKRRMMVMLMMKKKEEEVCVVDSDDDLVMMKKKEEKVCIVDSVDDLVMMKKEEEVCVVDIDDDFVMKKEIDEVCAVDSLDDLVKKEKKEEEVCIVDIDDDLVMKEEIDEGVCVVDSVDDLVKKEKIEEEVCIVNSVVDLTSEKKEEEVCVVGSVADLVMKQCRIVLRRVAAEDKDRVFCSFLKGINDDEGLIGCLDFESIDLRLGDGLYCGSHEAFYDDVQKIWRKTGPLFNEQPDLIKLAERLGKIFEEMYDKEVLTLFRKRGERDESLSRVGGSLIPKAPWEEGICKDCGMDKDDDNVLLCDGCQSEYRRCCLNPPLVKVPEGKWYCPSCVSGQCTLNSSGVNNQCELEKGQKLNQVANAMMIKESPESNREEMAGKKKWDDISKGKRPAKEPINSRTKVCKSFRSSGSIHILDREHSSLPRRTVQSTLLFIGQKQMGYQNALRAAVQRAPEHERQEVPSQVEESAQDQESSGSDSDSELSGYGCSSESSDSSSEDDDDLMTPAACQAAIEHSQRLGKTSQVRKSANVDLNWGSNKGPPKEGDILPIATIHGGHFTSTSAAGQNLISTYLTSNLRRKLRKFWPHWKNVPDKKRDELWEALKKEIDMSEVQENSAKRCFMKDNNTRYRNFLSKLKNTTMEERGLTHPTQLRGTPPPDWMPRRRAWKKYIEHWCSEKQLRKSKLGRSARMSTDGRDGEISKNGYGRVGLGNRQLREREKTGVQPPIHKIMSDVNEKRDKMGRVIKVVDSRTAKALKEAKEKYMTLEVHDPTAQFIPDELMAEVYLGSEVVKKGLDKNRVIGCGSLDQALKLMKVRPPPSCSSGGGAVDPEIYAEMQRLRKRDEERELQIREARKRERQLQEETHQLQARVAEAEIRRLEESRQLQERIAEAERLRQEEWLRREENMAQTQLSMSMQARLESLESLVRQRFLGDHSASGVSQPTPSSHSDCNQQQRQTQLPSDQITPPPSSTPDPPIS